jgi:soluble lytic murein transglycosylase-like protein
MRYLLCIIVVCLFSVNASANIYKHIADDGTIIITNAPLDKKDEIILKENPYNNQKPENRRNLKEIYSEIAEKKAQKHNIDHHLVKAIIKAESNWNPNAVSRKGAMGLMQLMPATAAFLGVKNPFDPEENIDGGIRYMKYLLEKFDSNLHLALAAYNAGPALVERIKGIPPIRETIDYVRKVINYYSSINKQQESSNNPLLADHKEPKKTEERIKKMVLADGTILFTNSYNIDTSKIISSSN